MPYSIERYSHFQDALKEQSLEITDELGEGGFGLVLSCTYVVVFIFQHFRSSIDLKRYAVKIIKLPDIYHENHLKEVRLLSDEPHANIVRYNSSWLRTVRYLFALLFYATRLITRIISSFKWNSAREDHYRTQWKLDISKSRTSKCGPYLKEF